MGYIYTADEFCKILTDIANNYKTLYVMGGIGFRLNDKGKERAYQNGWNRNEPRPSMINAADEHTWAFDCVCLVKSVLWGWHADESKTYGGANYGSNNVPDVSADGMIAKCPDNSTDFSNIIKGELVWMSGHVGVYIGDGKVVECTPAWQNKVQITNLKNIGKTASPSRQWVKHGRLPWIKYAEGKIVAPTKTYDEKGTWNYLLKAIGNTYGVAGLMGNLQAESGLRTNNVQNSYETRYGNDVDYTAKVDNGSYNGFASDSVGYGLAQWTSCGRKQKLYDYCKKQCTSIGEWNTQHDFLIQELKTSYKAVWNTLLNATSIKEASDAVLLKFEIPADRSDNMKNKRAKYGQDFFNKYAIAAPALSDPVIDKNNPVLKYGSSGKYVRLLQKTLNSKGYDCGEVDGQFGMKTKNAVLKFQRDNGLQQDGCVGPLTWSALK